MFSRLLPLLLASCTSMDMRCDMAIPAETAPVAQQGEVTIRWKFGDASRCSPTAYGCAFGSVIYLREIPNLADVCSLARLGHEVSHAMKARH